MCQIAAGLLSLKTKKLSYFREEENEGIRQQDQNVDQCEEQVEFHMDTSIYDFIMEDYVIFILQSRQMKVDAILCAYYGSLIKTKTPSNDWRALV